MSSSVQAAQIWDSPKPSDVARLQIAHVVSKSEEEDFETPMSQEDYVIRFARREAAKSRRTRAIWPKARVSSVVTSKLSSGCVTTTARDYFTDELIERILELVPLEGDADRDLFRKRLESLHHILGTDALSSQADDRRRTMLWYAVDAEDDVAVRELIAVFPKCAAKVITDAPEPENPHALAESRRLSSIVAQFDDLLAQSDLCPSPCSDADQAAVARFFFCVPWTTQGDQPKRRT